jgi:predicted MFS family arabinose efflux permease
VIPDTYRRVVSIREVRLPVLGATVGRLPFAGEALSVLLLVQGATGSFAEAGLVNACYSLGAAAGLPAQGRLVDRVGQTRVIAVATGVNAAALVVLVLFAEAEDGLLAMALAGLVAGVAVPPIGTCMRTLWSELVADPLLRQSAFALDAVMVEVAFIVGPLLMALVIGLASPAAAVLVNVAITVTGSVLFASSRASRRWKGEARDVGLSGPLREAGIRVLMGTGVGLGMAVGAVELGVTALAADHGLRQLGGALVAAQAAGSLIGGLLYGSRTWHGSAGRRLGLLSIGMAITTVPLVFTPSLEAAFPLMLISGFALAPTVSVLYVLLDSVAPPGTGAEATGWVLTAFVAGASAGSGLAGAAVNGSGPRAGLAVGLAGAALAVCVAWFGRGRLDPVREPGEQPFARVHSM